MSEVVSRRVETISETVTAGIEVHGSEDFVLWAKDVNELREVVELFLKKIRQANRE